MSLGVIATLAVSLNEVVNKAVNEACSGRGLVDVHEGTAAPHR